MSRTSLSSRWRTVDFPAPEGAETTKTLVARSLNVLHLLAQPLDLGLQVHDLLHEPRVGRLAPDRVRLAHHLLAEEVQPLARGLPAPQERPRHVQVAAQALELLGHVVALHRAHDL